MKMRNRTLTASVRPLAALVLSCMACSQRPSLSPEFEAFLNTAIDSIEANALMTDSVEWPAVRAAAFERAAGASSTVETYPAIRQVLNALGDRHSFLQLSDSLARAEQNVGPTGPESDETEPAREPSPFGDRMRPVFSLVERDGFRAGFVFMPQGRRSAEFARMFQDSLAILLRGRPCGWIVDLRGNGGGDMWPMLAGLGPLIGEGDMGGSVSAHGARDRWRYDDGHAIYVDSSGVEREMVTVDRFVTARPDAPVAVLIDRGTASSGEAMAVAFRGRARTRFFGERTYGASTATRGIRLADGANLVIAVSTFVDRDAEPYPWGVTPDEEAPIRRPGSVMEPDPAVEAALAWFTTANGECPSAGA